MKRHFKKLSVALIGVILVVAVCFGMFSGCGKKYDITAYIFAGEADQETNTQLVNAWAEQYAAAHAEEIGKDSISVGISFQSDTTKYFAELNRQLASGRADDVFYVSPKYVKSYAAGNVVLDLTKYVDWTKYDPNGLWSQSVGAYALQADGDIGDPVTYDTASKAFKTESGETASVYALPKDFSSFGLAYNRNFFTAAAKDAYTKETNTGGATTYPDGSAAPLISIGRTVNYKPFNFYDYATYEAALAAGDPIAKSAEVTGGYDVTILGWPGDTYDTGEEDIAATAYDESVGYVTYTYAEYSAMAWAVCYYAERCDMTDTNGDGQITGAERQTHELFTWLNDSAGYQTLNGTNYVYGNDQFEGTLYLTAWLLGNDAQIISDDYKSVTDPGDGSYGIDSEAFKEAYAAFLAFGSDWNANSYFSGSPEVGKDSIGGWLTFNGGRCVFYGIGTWDLATFNSARKEVLDVGIMPEPVSEDFSPYATVKGPDYKKVPYHNATLNAANTPINDTSLFAYDEDWNVIANDAWEAYQNERQDQWFARLDTVGYGVNADLSDLGEEDSWKLDAAADLCAYLTMDETTQLALTYAGSQLTTFVDQGVDYLYYKNDVTAPEGLTETGSFSNMITPEGNASGSLTVTAAEISALSAQLPSGFNKTELTGEEVWTFATAVAQKMHADHTSAGGTVKSYIDTNFPSMSPYLNSYFQNENMSDVVSTAYAYKCLCLVSLRYEDRNLQLRMVSGDNGALDSCMYTYNSLWIDEFGATKGYTLIAWNANRAPGAWSRVLRTAVPDTPVDTITEGNADGSGWSGNFYTPSNFCEWIVKRSQSLLNAAIEEEAAMLGE